MIGSLVSVMLATGVLYLWYGYRVRRFADQRLAEMIGGVDSAESREEPRRTIRTFPPRYRLAAPATGVVTGAALWLIVGMPLEISAAAGLLSGVVAHLIEDYVGDQQAAVIEAQLAAAIYLMVASLRAGASLLAAFESALEEVGPPLRPYFQEVAGRIRLGDDPRTAVSDLQENVPLETFRLFATSQWMAAWRRRYRRWGRRSGTASSCRGGFAPKASSRTRRSRWCWRSRTSWRS